MCESDPHPASAYRGGV